MGFVITEQEKKDILSLYNLVEDFKTQKMKFILQGNDENVVNTYLDDFRMMKNKGYKELVNSDLSNVSVPKGNDRLNVDNYRTFNELKNVVDYVASQKNVGSVNYDDIIVDGTPIFENDDVVIYYAPNRRACVTYVGDKSYSWCVARKKEGNMYYSYRSKFTEPTFYFVKLKKRTEEELKDFEGKFKDKWHFFVVQTLNNGQYVITSASNDGDVETSWDGILKVAPELKGLQEYFQHTPHSEQETKIFDLILNNNLSDEEFAGLPYKVKNEYISVLPSILPLSNGKFFNLPIDLQNDYITKNPSSISKEQFEYIKQNPKLLKRFINVSFNDENFGEFLLKAKYTRFGVAGIKGTNPQMIEFPEQFSDPSTIFDNIDKRKLIEWGKQMSKVKDRNVLNSYMLAMLYFDHFRDSDAGRKVLDYFGIPIQEFFDFFKKPNDDKFNRYLSRLFEPKKESNFIPFVKTCYNPNWSHKPDSFFDGKEYKEYTVNTYDEWVKLWSTFSSYHQNQFDLTEDEFNRYTCGSIDVRMVHKDQL